MTTYTFQEGTWQGAEVWAWTDGLGELVGRADFVTANGDDFRIRVRLETGRTSPAFADKADALAWVEVNR